jgi:hypothetical protein
MPTHQELKLFLIVNSLGFKPTTCPYTCFRTEHDIPEIRAFLRQIAPFKPGSCRSILIHAGPLVTNLTGSIGAGLCL